MVFNTKFNIYKDKEPKQIMKKWSKLDSTINMSHYKSI